MNSLFDGKKDGSTVLIAEVGQAHDGSLGACHSFIDLVSDVGFDGIKFQTHFADAESTLDEPFRIKFSEQDVDRYSYWKRMEFDRTQWKGLFDHAERRGLIPLSTPFSSKALRMLDDLQVPAWKIGSGEYKSWNLVEEMLETGKPIILSTGMSNVQEIDDMVALIERNGNELILMQCTSCYPTRLEDVGLNILSSFQERYRCRVGLSDHSGSVWPSVVAMSRGISLLEVHVALHRLAFGPDTSSSLTPDELAMIVEAREAIRTMDHNSVDKDEMALRLKGMRRNFTKSVALAHPLPAGSVIRDRDLVMKKPGGGIDEASLNEVVGKRLIDDMGTDRLLRWEDLIDPSSPES